MENTPEQNFAMNREWKAWQVIFDEMCKVFNTTREELNTDKYTQLFEDIRTWANLEAIRGELLDSEQFGRK